MRAGIAELYSVQDTIPSTFAGLKIYLWWLEKRQELWQNIYVDKKQEMSTRKVRVIRL